MRLIKALIVGVMAALASAGQAEDMSVAVHSANLPAIDGFAGDDSSPFAQLESVVSEQLKLELEKRINGWLEINGISIGPGLYDLNVDPLIANSDVSDGTAGPEIQRVIVEVYFARGMSEELIAAAYQEISSLLVDRGYVLNQTTADGEKRVPSRPLAHVEVYAATSEASAMGTVSVPVVEKSLDLRRALAGATFTVLTAILFLFAFILRQIRRPQSAPPSPVISRKDPALLSNDQENSVDLEALERGKNLRIGDSLALMNFEQAITFLGNLDRLRRKVVLARLPVHSSIKVRLAKALASKPQVINTAK